MLVEAGQDDETAADQTAGNLGVAGRGSGLMRECELGKEDSCAPKEGPRGENERRLTPRECIVL